MQFLLYRGYYYDSETGLYYLQSRYYDPEIGRFINADALASTGQGILGSNMFAYCNNNPVNMSDESGTIPLYDNPLQKAIEEFFEWFNEINENETDSYGKLTHTAKLKRLARSVAMNLELSMGVGLGIFGETTVFEILGLGAGAYFNPLSIQIQDGEIYAGEEINQGISASLYGHNYGNVEGGFSPYGEEIDLISTIGFYNDETLTIYSAALYKVYGGSFRIGFDIVSFLDDFDAIRAQ